MTLWHAILPKILVHKTCGSSVTFEKFIGCYSCQHCKALLHANNVEHREPVVT